MAENAILAPRSRPVSPGRPKIGPKIQVNIPLDQFNFIRQVLAHRGCSLDDWPDILREVVGYGVKRLEEVEEIALLSAAGTASSPAGEA